MPRWSKRELAEMAAKARNAQEARADKPPADVDLSGTFIIALLDQRRGRFAIKMTSALANLTELYPQWIGAGYQLMAAVKCPDLATGQLQREKLYQRYRKDRIDGDWFSLSRFGQQLLEELVARSDGDLLRSVKAEWG